MGNIKLPSRSSAMRVAKQSSSLTSQTLDAHPRWLEGALRSSVFWGGNLPWPELAWAKCAISLFHCRNCMTAFPATLPLCYRAAFHGNRHTWMCTLPTACRFATVPLWGTSQCRARTLSVRGHTLKECIKSMQIWGLCQPPLA